MAIVTAIKEKTQSRTAMKKVMDYVAQDYKILFQNENGEQCRLLSGQNCCGETAFQEFMATKKQYRKESKAFFYQYVQSFKPNCGATPQEIHQMGIELARRFEGYEVQIATHIDRDHWHNHLIVNSVSCETGLKLQFNEKDLEQLRTLSDEICLAHGLEILKPYQKPAMKPMGAGEYRSAVRGSSFKFQLMNAIDTALSQSRTQAEFTACMEEMGYGSGYPITNTSPTPLPQASGAGTTSSMMKNISRKGWNSTLPNLNELKALNKPQEIPQKLTTPYLPQVSAIPTEEWDAMLNSQAVLLERMAALGQYISTLPTTPEIEKAIRDYCQGIYDNQGDMLCRVINDQHRRISQTVNDKIDKSQDSLKWQLQEGFQKQTERLRHRDMLPWKLKVKWTAVGLLSSTVLYTLLSLLKIL